MSQSKKKDRPLIINSDPASPLPYALLFFRHFLHHPHVVTLFPPCWRLLFNSLLSSIDSSVLGDFVTSVAVAIAQLRPHPSPFIRGFGAPLFCHRSPHVTMPLRGHLHGPTKSELMPLSLLTEHLYATLWMLSKHVVYCLHLPKHFASHDIHYTSCISCIRLISFHQLALISFAR